MLKVHPVRPAELAHMLWGKAARLRQSKHIRPQACRYSDALQIAIPDHRVRVLTNVHVPRYPSSREPGQAHQLSGWRDEAAAQSVHVCSRKNGYSRAKLTFFPPPLLLVYQHELFLSINRIKSINLLTLCD